MAMLSPAVGMMGKLKYPYKFVMISVLFLCPMLWLFIDSISHLNADLDFVDKELKGTAYLAQLRPLPQKIAQHRGKMNAFLKGGSGLKADLEVLEGQVDAAFQQLSNESNNLAFELDVAAQIRGLNKSWQQLRDTEFSDAGASFEQHSILIRQLQKLIVRVADNSNLILDSSLDTFYLIDASVSRLPKITENLGKVRGMAAGMAAAGRAEREQLFKMRNLIAAVRTEMENLEYALSQSGTVNRDVTRELLVPTKAINAEAEQYLSYIEANSKNNYDLEEMRSQQVFSQGTEIIDRFYRVYDNALAKLDQLLRERAEQYRWQRLLEVVTLIASLSVIVYLYIAFYLSVQRSIRAIVETSKELMRGNLTSRIQVDTNDETAEIHKSFNSMAENFNNIVRDVNQVSGVLNSSVENVAVVAEQTSKNVRDQHDQTQQVAAAITEMSASANEIASNTSQASAAADSAFEKTTEANHLVASAKTAIDDLVGQINQAVNVMNSMASESESIGRVLDVIKSIAEQTNLLALNAAIEAARAGDQGRGFAVVADEVRTLAKKTHDSTSEIQAMIEQLQARSRDAVAVIEMGHERAAETERRSLQTVASLNEVEQAISHLNQMITGIACAAEEQTATCEEIARNISFIENRTRDTSEGAEQTATAGSTMAGEAERLKSMVQRFITS